MGAESRIHRAAFTLALLAAAKLAHGAGASPAERSWSLGWARVPGAESCIGPRALARAVEARLGHPVFSSAAAAELAVVGRVERTTEGWRAAITVEDRDGAVLGMRELKAPGPLCSALDDSVVLAIAVMISPESVFAPPVPPPAPAPPQPQAAPPPAAPLPYPAPPVPEKPRGRSFDVATGLGVTFAEGLLPNLSVGLVSRVSVTPRGAWPIEIGSLLWAPNSAGKSDQGARFTLALGRLATCPASATLGRMRLSACAGVELGALRAGGFGFSVARQYERFVLNGSVTGRLSFRIAGPFEAAAGLAVLVPVIRDRFTYINADRVHMDVFRMSAVAGSLDASLGVSIP